MENFKKTFFLAGIIISMIILASPFCMAEEEKVIKIGIIGPMKHLPGIDGWKGAVVAAEEINENGGIDLGGVKHKLELIKADSNEQASVSDAVNATERLIKFNKVDFIVGGYRSEAGLAMQEPMANHKIIFINTGSSSPQLAARLAENYDKYKYWFRVGVCNVKHIGITLFGTFQDIMKTVKTELGFSKPRVAILAEQALWNKPLVKLVEEKIIPQMGGEVSGIWRPLLSASDITAELNAIKSADTQVIFQMLAGPVGIAGVRQWGQYKIPAALIGLNNEAQSPTHWEETNGMCNYEATYHTISKAPMTSKTIPFYNHFEKRWGVRPALFGAGNYDSIYILKEVIEQNDTLNSDVLVEAMENGEFVGVATNRVCFYPKDHKWPHDLKFGPGYTTHIGIQWRDGTYETTWPNGEAVMGDKNWEGFKYTDTVPYQLPPWMEKYWKNK